MLNRPYLSSYEANTHPNLVSAANFNCLVQLSQYSKDEHGPKNQGQAQSGLR